MGLVVDSSGVVLSGDILESAPSETSDVVNAVAELIESTVAKVGLRPSPRPEAGVVMRILPDHSSGSAGSALAAS
jgi:hypothetical protein